MQTVSHTRQRDDDGIAERPEYAYFPFGGGPRRCIGAAFATVEAQLIPANDVEITPTER